MKKTATRFQTGLLALFLLQLLWSTCCALKHNFAVKEDKRVFMGPLGIPFGFLAQGCFKLDVYDFRVTAGGRHHGPDNTDEYEEELLKKIDAGFLLRRFKSESQFSHYEETIRSNSSACIFDYFRDHDDGSVFGGSEDDDSDFVDTGEFDVASTEGIFIPIRYHDSGWASEKASVAYEFKSGEEGLYILMFQVCFQSSEDAKRWGHDIRNTFELDFHNKNVDFLGQDSYLTAGEMPLPSIFLYFSVSYSICFLTWVLNIRSIQQEKGGFLSPGLNPQIFAIHHLMSVLVLLKTLSVLLESIRYHFIRVAGHAEIWSFVYYGVTFVKGVFLFTVVLLVGSGWSFVKPFLTTREKRVILTVLILQVVDNLALVILSTETEGEAKYDKWSAVLHLVDILCCCAVLVPIVWQVNALESKMESSSKNYDGNENNDSQDGVVDQMALEDDARTSHKLKMFRTCYLLVVAYIYATRIAVYLFATILDYKHTWVRFFVTELATLLFYVVSGLQFRPNTEQVYKALTTNGDEECDVGDGEAEIVFEKDMELHTRSVAK